MKRVGLLLTCVFATWTPVADETPDRLLLGHFMYQAQVLPDEGTTVRRLDVDLTGDAVPELLLAKPGRVPNPNPAKISGLDSR